jgi:predicted DNA-binding transcriptional regulator AlpA
MHGQRKKLISANQAAKILECSRSTFWRQERKAGFQRIPAPSDEKKETLGRPVTWFYDDEEIRAYAKQRKAESRKTRIRKTHSLKKSRRLEAYRLFREGCALDDVALRTQLDPEEVDELHQLYIRQTNQLTIPGHLILALENMRFDVRKNPEGFVETVGRMVRMIRKEPGAAARVDVTVTPLPEADATDTEPESGSNKGSSNA